MENYTYYEGKDSFGYDIKYYPNKTVNQLIDICDGMDAAIGFNTYGYIKYKVVPDNQFIKLHDTNCGLYVKKNKYRDMVDKKKQKIINSLINQQANSNLTFTITTCKRFNLFQQTMDMFILNCQDVHTISEWLCVDDNSSQEDRSKMQSLYPFFKFI